MRLDEIKKLLDMEPLPFKWLDSARCVFNNGHEEIGIFVEFDSFTLSDGTQCTFANVVFGPVVGEFRSEKDLSLSLTGRGAARTVFSTVAAACIANKRVTSVDLIVLGAVDEVKDKRTLLYSLALGEIKRKEHFDDRHDIRVKTQNGTFLSILSRRQFSNEQQKEIADTFKVEKV